MTRYTRPLQFTVWTALALLLATASSAPAQDRQLLADSSAGNAISTRTVVQLSFEGLDVAPDVQARVFRLPGGGWGVSAAVFAGTVQLFDTAGAPAGTFGRSGQGPGELGGQVFAVPMRGELWVVDPRNARLSIFAEDLRLADDRPLDVQPLFVAPARDGRSLLVSGSGAAYADDMYHAVARMTREPGTDVFGDPLGPQPPPMSETLVQGRMAAETADGEIWAVAISGGGIDVLRSRDLSVMEHLQLPGSEMAREAPWSLTDLTERPAPRLAGIAADSSAVLWVSVAVADPAWAPGMDPRESVENYYDTRVLAIDPAERAVVGTVQLDELCMSVERNLISCVNELGQTIRVVALRLNS